MRERQSLTNTLIVIIVGAYLLTYVYPNITYDLALIYGGQYSNGYFPGVSTGQWYRLFTVALTHANWLHLGSNMLALWSVGTPLERIFGRLRYMIIFLGSLLCASLTSVYLGPHNIFAVGASGAIFGLFGALLVVSRKVGMNYQSIGATIILNLIITFTVPGIDWHAHLGGLVSGALLAYLLSRTPRRRPTTSF
jgi:rhomboid protease GluP